MNLERGVPTGFPYYPINQNMSPLRGILGKEHQKATESRDRFNIVRAAQLAVWRLKVRIKKMEDTATDMSAGLVDFGVESLTDFLEKSGLTAFYKYQTRVASPLRLTLDNPRGRHLWMVDAAALVGDQIGDGSIFHVSGQHVATTILKKKQPLVAPFMHPEMKVETHKGYGIEFVYTLLEFFGIPILLTRFFLYSSRFTDPNVVRHLVDLEDLPVAQYNERLLNLFFENGNPDGNLHPTLTETLQRLSNDEVPANDKELSVKIDNWLYQFYQLTLTRAFWFEALRNRMKGLEGCPWKGSGGKNFATTHLATKLSEAYRKYKHANAGTIGPAILQIDRIALIEAVAINNCALYPVTNRLMSEITPTTHIPPGTVVAVLTPKKNGQLAVTKNQLYKGKLKPVRKLKELNWTGGQDFMNVQNNDPTKAACALLYPKGVNVNSPPDRVLTYLVDKRQIAPCFNSLHYSAREILKIKDIGDILDACLLLNMVGDKTDSFIATMVNQMLQELWPQPIRLPGVFDNLN